jgi:hypothetical protein
MDVDDYSRAIYAAPGVSRPRTLRVSVAAKFIRGAIIGI